MYRILTLILTLYCSFSSLIGQTPFDPSIKSALDGPMINDAEPYKKGYIVTKSDTIWCYVENYNYEYGDAYVLFKVNRKDKEPELISYKEILEVFDSTYFYNVVKIEKDLILLRRLCSGPVLLFEQEKTIETSFGPKIKTKYFLQSSGLIVKLSKSSFKEELKKVFAENQEILSEIDKMEYDEVCTNIKVLVDKYNDWLLNSKKKS